MDVSVQTEWRAVLAFEGISRGNLFLSKIADVVVLCLAVRTENDEDFVIILAHEGQDEDLKKFPPPVSRSYSALDSDATRIYLDLDHPLSIETQDRFPSCSEPQHGNLLIDGEGRPWIACDDFPHPQRKLRLYVELRTGACMKRCPARPLIYKRWRAGRIIDQNMANPLIAFGWK